MRCILCAILLLTLGLGAATQPASKPSTHPAKTRYALMHGGVKYMILSDWKETLRTDDDISAQYRSPDGKALISVSVSQQQQGIPEHNESLIEQMKTSIVKNIRKTYVSRGDQILYGPRSETDDRFMLRIHVRYKHEGKTLDEMHLYRAGGLDFLMVMTQVETDQPDLAKPEQEKGEDVSLSMILSQPDRKKPSK